MGQFEGKGTPIWDGGKLSSYDRTSTEKGCPKWSQQLSGREKQMFISYVTVQSPLNWAGYKLTTLCRDKGGLKNPVWISWMEIIHFMFSSGICHFKLPCTFQTYVCIWPQLNKKTLPLKAQFSNFSPVEGIDFGVTLNMKKNGKEKVWIRFFPQNRHSFICKINFQN